MSQTSSHTKPEVSQKDELRPAGFYEVVRASIGVLRLVARANPRLVVSILIFAIILGALPVIENAIRGSLINHLVVAAGTAAWTNMIGLLLGGVVLIAYLSGVLSRLDGYLTQVLWRRTRHVVEFEVIRAKTTLSLEQHEDPKMSNLVQRVTERGGEAPQFATQTIDLVSVSITALTAAIALASSYWWLLGLVVLGLLPQLVYQSIFSREIWKQSSENTERWRHFWRIRTYFWSPSDIIEVKLFGLVGYLTSRARKLHINLINEDLGLRRSQFNRSLGLSFISQTTIAFALGFFVYEVLHGRLQVGTLTFLFATVVTLSSSLIRLFALTGRQYEMALFMTELIALLKTPSSMTQPKNARVLAPGVTPTIVFEDVSFTYPDAEKPALEHVNFTLAAGDKLALIGVNGAGKTTLVKLLCRLYDPTSGRITVDGTDLREVDLQSYYAHFGVLFQEFNRYNMPIREVIAIGDTSTPIDDERVRKAAKDSEADAFIAGFSRGYDQLLGKDFTDGTDLSGGQWQKLAIARVFYRNPRIWILDEPTAAIDAESEARIFDRIEKLPDDQSGIVISHRFSTVRNADRILVLKDGTISEEGTHEELMKHKKDYARLFSLQAERYQGKNA